MSIQSVKAFESTGEVAKLRVSTLFRAALGYFVCCSLATFPAILSFRKAIPGYLGDPLEHLWIMRWYRDCLIHGQSPFFCHDLNAPSGVPLGFFPTMHMQTLVYALLSGLGANDYICFNMLWLFGFVSTGLGTFVLAWWVVRKAFPAWLAGLGTMLSGPMMMHAHGHLETMQLGVVPIFLIAWFRFVDHPKFGRMIFVVLLYLIQVAAAPYYAVLAVFPACLYVVWSLLTSNRAARRAFLWSRFPWFLGFVLLVLPGLILIFAPQIWASSHGYDMSRSRAEFNQFRSTLWSTFVPSTMHNLRPLFQSLIPRLGTMDHEIESSSYLGIVTLSLMFFALLYRFEFPRRTYWWASFALLTMLSWGAFTTIGSTRVSLPAGWLYSIFPPFQLIRCPTRFNLFASVCVAVPAAVGADVILCRLRQNLTKLMVTVGLSVVIVAELSMISFPTAIIPPMPSIYGQLRDKSPKMSIVDAPVMGADGSAYYSSIWGYWQSIHQAKTTAGYPGLVNVPFVAEHVPTSPFWERRLADSAYLADFHSESFGLVHQVNPRDYVWLYLHAHHFNYVFLHHAQACDPKYEMGAARLAQLFIDTKIHEENGLIVFDRERITPPRHLTWLCAEGFRPALAREAPWAYGALRKARVFVCIPDDDQGTVKLSLVDAVAFQKRRVVQLWEGAKVLAELSIDSDSPRTIEFPPIALSPGIHEWTLVADGDSRPSKYIERLDLARTPYSFRLQEIRVGKPID